MMALRCCDGEERGGGSFVFPVLQFKMLLQALVAATVASARLIEIGLGTCVLVKTRIAV